MYNLNTRKKTFNRFWAVAVGFCELSSVIRRKKKNQFKMKNNDRHKTPWTCMNLSIIYLNFRLKFKDVKWFFACKKDTVFKFEDISLFKTIFTFKIEIWDLFDLIVYSIRLFFSVNKIFSNINRAQLPSLLQLSLFERMKKLKVCFLDILPVKTIIWRHRNERGRDASERWPWALTSNSRQIRPF